MSSIRLSIPVDDLALRVTAELKELLEHALQADTRSPWLTVPEAAEHLRTTPAAIRSMVKRGELPVHRTPNGRLLFHRQELDAWVDGQDWNT